MAASSTATDKKESDVEWVIKGQVLGLSGKPASDVEVGTFWSANGDFWDEDGDFPKVETEEEAAELWNDEGTMDPYPRLRATLLGNGHFEIEKAARSRRSYTVLALNKQRTHGGLAYSSADSDESLSIKLKPLVRVYGEIRCDGKIPGWTYAYVFPGELKHVPP